MVRTRFELHGPYAGDLLAALRRRIGLSQRQAVRGTELGPAALSRIESGDRQIGVKAAIALSTNLPIRVVIENGEALLEEVDFPDDPL